MFIGPVKKKMMNNQGSVFLTFFFFCQGILSGRVGRFPSANVELASLKQRTGIGQLMRVGNFCFLFVCFPGQSLFFFEGKDVQGFFQLDQQFWLVESSFWWWWQFSVSNSFLSGKEHVRLRSLGNE